MAGSTWVPWDDDDPNGEVEWYCDDCWDWYEIEQTTDYYTEELVDKMPQCTAIATKVFGERPLMRSICSFIPVHDLFIARLETMFE